MADSTLNRLEAAYVALRTGVDIANNIQAREREQSGISNGFRHTLAQLYDWRDDEAVPAASAAAAEMKDEAADEERDPVNGQLVSARLGPVPVEAPDVVPVFTLEESAMLVISGKAVPKLLPCPFCGSSTSLDVERDATVICGDEDQWVRCDSCETGGPRSRFGCRDDEAEDPGIDLEAEARRYWNERAPIPMILHCPRCQLQHLDTPDPEHGWENPPHRSHLCHGCQAVWRPADVPTTGVARIETRGKADTWP